MITVQQAILSLVRGCAFSVEDGKIINWIGDVPQPTEEEIATELARLQQEYDAAEYQRLRASEYPSFADQFDLLYHGGYDAWKASIDEIKNKYPKGATE